MAKQEMTPIVFCPQKFAAHRVRRSRRTGNRGQRLDYCLLHLSARFAGECLKFWHRVPLRLFLSCDPPCHRRAAER